MSRVVVNNSMIKMQTNMIWLKVTEKIYGELPIHALTKLQFVSQRCNIPSQKIMSLAV